MPMMMPDGTPIPDNQDPRKKLPVTGGPAGIMQPGGNMPDPTRQPSIPITDASQAKPPITGGPVGVQTPQQPYHNPVWDHPGNRRWREARAQGMTAEQFQNQGAASQVPNTAQLVPNPQVPQAPGPQGKGPIINEGYGRMYPRQPYGPNEARMTAQRRYFRGSRTPQF